MTPYCSGAMVHSCASCMYWASYARIVRTTLRE